MSRRAHRRRFGRGCRAVTYDVADVWGGPGHRPRARETSLKVDGVAFVELKLVDEDGRTVTNGDRAVTASISGPGELVGW